MPKIPWLSAPSSIFTASSVASFLSLHFHLKTFSSAVQFSHLKITSSKSLLPHKATFTGSRGENVDRFGGHDSYYHRQESGYSAWVSLSPIHHDLPSLLGSPLVIQIKASLLAQKLKNLPACSRPGSGRSPGEGHGYPLQYFCLENSMERGEWLQSMGSQRVRHN